MQYALTSSVQSLKMPAEWVRHICLANLSTSYPPAAWLGHLWPYLLIGILSIAVLWVVARCCCRPAFRLITCLILLGNFVLLAKNYTYITYDLGNLLLAEILKMSSIAQDETVLEVSKKTAATAFLMFVAAFLFIYRRLEILNTRRTLPEIRVEELVDEQGQKQRGLEALLRESIYRAAPHAPSGHTSEGVDYIAKFLDKKPLGPSDHNWVSKTFASIFRLVVPSRALNVRGAIIAPKNNHEFGGVAISVKEERTHKIIISRTYRDKNIQDAIESAGYNVAEYAIQQCPTVPKWASWSAEGENSTFLNYWRGIRESSNPKGDIEEARKQLEEATQKSRDNILARLQLAAVLEAQENYIDAIELYLAVTSRYRLLFDARYRIAVLLGKLGFYCCAKIAASPEELVRLKQAIESNPIEGSKTNRPSWPDPNDSKKLQIYFSDLAIEHWRALIHDFQWWYLAWRCLKNTADRRYLWPRFLWNHQRRNAAVCSMKIAQLCDRLLKHRLEQPTSQYGYSGDEIIKDLKEEAMIVISYSFCSEKLRQILRKDPKKLCSILRKKSAPIDFILHRRKNLRTRAKKGWWGLPHYTLACFYALLLPPQEDASPAKPTSVWNSWTPLFFPHWTPLFFPQMRPLSSTTTPQAIRRIAPEEEDEIVKKAVEHLNFSLLDPQGPLIPGSLWWMILQDDRDIKSLQRHEYFKNWKYTCLRFKERLTRPGI